MLNFEWDERKAARNLRNDGVSFEEASTVFGDPCALSFLDVEHSDHESRSRTYGRCTSGRVLVVVHTDRAGVLRIISARKATRYEKAIYANG